MDLKTIKTYLSRHVMIRETFFSLSWVLSAFVLLKIQNIYFHWNIVYIVLLSLTYITARFVGMSVNRFVDAEFDAHNPRTKARLIPSGELLKHVAFKQIMYLCLSYLVALLFLPKKTAIFGLIALGIIILYSYTKRFTSFCHFVLGAVHFLAPICIVSAVVYPIPSSVFLLASVQAITISASDILYSCQDIEIDRKLKLNSIPSIYGEKNAKVAACFLHMISAGILFYLGRYLHLSIAYFLGILLYITGHGILYILLYKKRIHIHSLFRTQNLFSGCTILCTLCIELFTQRYIWHV